MNLHMPPEIAKQRQQQMMMQMQAENQLYSVALQVFLRFVQPFDSEENLDDWAKLAIRAAELFTATVAEHQKAKHAEQTSPIKVD